jgi:glucose/arabinose dehydrogenase
MTPEVPVRTAFGAAPAVFYSGARFRTGCKADAFVALHATGPCKAPDGFKVARQFANRMPEGGYGNFVTDFILDPPLGRARR